MAGGCHCANTAAQGGPHFFRSTPSSSSYSFSFSLFTPCFPAYLWGFQLSALWDLREPLSGPAATSAPATGGRRRAARCRRGRHHPARDGSVTLWRRAGRYQGALGRQCRRLFPSPSLSPCSSCISSSQACSISIGTRHLFITNMRRLGAPCPLAHSLIRVSLLLTQLIPTMFEGALSIRGKGHAGMDNRSEETSGAPGD